MCYGMHFHKNTQKHTWVELRRGAATLCFSAPRAFYNYGEITRSTSKVWKTGSIAIYVHSIWVQPEMMTEWSSSMLKKTTSVMVAAAHALLYSLFFSRGWYLIEMGWES